MLGLIHLPFAFAELIYDLGLLGTAWAQFVTVCIHELPICADHFPQDTSNETCQTN